jgi:hypothetical protein
MAYAITSRVLDPKSRVLPINLDLANNVGKAEALLLQQLYYWITSDNKLLGKIHKGKRWVHNSHKAWSRELKIYSARTIARAIKNLEELGIIMSDFLSHFKGNRTKWYTIDYDKLNAFLSSFKPGKPPISDPKKCPDHIAILATSSCQNGNMYNETEITSEMNTGLNCACARETLQPVVEECKQPGGAVSTVVESAPATVPTSAPKAHQGDVIEDPGSNQIREAEPTPETKSLSEVIDPEPQTLTEPNLTVDEFVNQSLEIVQEIIGSKLDHPLSINMGIFARTIKKRMGTHFGLGALGLSRFSDYCKTFADTPFLMGQKAMKSRDRFTVSIGSILSEKMIERFWDKSKFWQTWPPKKPTPEELQVAEDARQLESSERQALSLEEALTTAQDSVDKEVKQKLYHALEAMTYKAWIVATGFVARGFENGEPLFDINTAFARDYLWTHHEQQLRSAFACGTGRN